MKSLVDMDVRIKMACMAFFSIVVLKAGANGLIALSILCIALWGVARFKAIEIIRHFRMIVLLLAIVFLARAVTVSFFIGAAGRLISLDPKGAVEGAVICWRLVILTFLGIVWMSTTRPSGIRTAVEWFCRPFPGMHGKQVATMMGLVVRFLPVLLERARETSAAQQCRCIQNRRNPVYRTVKFAIPLLCRTLETADQLADAMEARCFRPENSRPLALKPGRSDWLALLGTTVLCALILVS